MLNIPDEAGESSQLFTPEAMRAMRNVVAGGGGFDTFTNAYCRVQMILNSPLLLHTVCCGWLTWSDLNIQMAVASVSLRTNGFQRQPCNKY
jgi:hypothetical protein